MPDTVNARPLTEKQRKLVEENLGYAIVIARRMRHCQLPREDRRQAGVLGLMAASRNFDETKTARFGAHAMPYIKREILRAEAFHKMIYIPTKVYHKKPQSNSTKNRELRIGNATKIKFEDDHECFDAIGRPGEVETACMEKEEQETIVASVREAASWLRGKEAITINMLLKGNLQIEIAKEIGCTPENVYCLRKKAFAKLRDALHRYSGEAS